MFTESKPFPPKNPHEHKVYGVESCMALFETRPQDIVRVYLDKRHLKRFSPLLKWCASNKKAYHIIPDEELERVTASTHHEGICILAKKPAPLDLTKIFAHSGSLLFLDGVENPHNVGSIMRTAAHFGCPYILGEEGKMPSLSGSAMRIARGGAEHTQLIHCNSTEEVLEQLKNQGFTLVCLDPRASMSLFDYTPPKKTVYILGAEDRGLSRQTKEMADVDLQIPGTGAMESLNVSATTALILGRHWQVHGA